MPNRIGALTNIGVAREVTRGTAVTAQAWIPKDEFSFNDNVEYIKQEAPYGVIQDLMDGEVGKNWGAGSISGPVQSDSIGYILGSTFGAFPTPTGTANGYTHVFNVAQNAQHASLTLTRFDANEFIRFPLTVVNSLEINYELGSYLTFTADFMSKQGVTTTSSAASYTNVPKFRPQDVSVIIADTFAGLGSGTAVPVESATIKIEKNVTEFQTLGSTDIADIHNGRFGFTATFVLIWDDATYKGFFKAGTKKAFRFRAVNTNRVIGGGSTNPSIQFDIAPSLLEEFGLDETNDGVLKQTIGITGLYDITTGNSIICTLVNAISAY
jgi:hypothetical protein